MSSERNSRVGRWQTVDIDEKNARLRPNGFGIVSRAISPRCMIGHWNGWKNSVVAQTKGTSMKVFLSGTHFDATDHSCFCLP